MLCDIFEATNKFETGSLFDVFFSRTLNHGFGFCKRKKRENIEHKIDKIFFADSTNFLLIGKNARLTKNGGSIKKAQKFNLKNFVN